ncbi:MAG: hypothetical protein QGI25_15135 [Arenicellales bacterium]|nr:hypothetical protein [Arenicellales bacterium]
MALEVTAKIASLAFELYQPGNLIFTATPHPPAHGLLQLTETILTCVARKTQLGKQGFFPRLQIKKLLRLSFCPPSVQ